MESTLLKIIDLIYRFIPRKIPPAKKLGKCKIISHRGEHNNKQIMENTIEAFDRALQAGIWGIEFDVRWTSDLHPVISHDSNLKRVFNSPMIINKTTLADLRSNLPQIPTLAEVVKRYGGKIHLMVEIKRENYPDKNLQLEKLKNIFSSLTPEKNFHFMSIHPKMLEMISFVPKTTLILIAILRIKKHSKIAIKKQYGGTSGHYVLLPNSIIKKHHHKKQKIGTGFSNSKNSLFREINREVDWIFSNKATELNRILTKLPNSN